MANIFENSNRDKGKGKEELEPDYLDEDSVISNQKYFILSYVLPKDPIKQQPLIKVRGSFSTIEECEKRIKRLQIKDTYFNMFIAEVGKWGNLMTDEQLKNQDIDSMYQDERMNKMIKDYKENKDKVDKEYAERKTYMEQKAREEGTVEGQKKLAEEINPMKVKISLHNIEEQIKQINLDLEKLKESKEQNKKLMEGFTQEEIEESEKNYREYQEKLKELEKNSSS